MSQPQNLQEILDAAKAQILVDVKATAIKLCDLVPLALEIAAKQTPTPVDDIIVASLKENATKALKDLIAKV